MTYASLIQTLPETLRSSTSLAALASLGIHGLLWAVLPVLSFDSSSTTDQSQRTVGLVELTADEQSRLPQASTPQVTLPPFATQSSELPPLPPPPSLNLLPSAPQPSVLPPLPPTASFKILPPATQQSVLPPLPPPSSLRILPPSRTPVSKDPFSAFLPQPQTLPQPRPFQVPRPAPNQNNPSFTSQFSFAKPPAPVPNQTYRSGESLPTPRRLKPPAISGLPSTRGLKPAEPFSLPDIQPNQLAQANTNPQNTNRPQNQPQQQQLAANPVPPSAQPSKLPERGKQEFLALQQQARERLAQNRVGSTSQPQNTPPRLRREELVEALRQQQPARSRVGSTSQPIARANTDTRSPATSSQLENTLRRERQERVAALQQKLRQQQSARNPAGSTSVATTRTIQQLNDFEARQQKVQQENPKVETKAPIRQKLKTCQKQLDGSVAYVGAVVNPQGKLVSGPDLISKTGAADIAQAKARVRSYPFQATSNTTNYNFTIEFKYDTGNCREATPEPSPENTESQRSKS